MSIGLPDPLKIRPSMSSDTWAPAVSRSLSSFSHYTPTTDDSTIVPAACANRVLKSYRNLQNFARELDGGVLVINARGSLEHLCSTSREPQRQIFSICRFLSETGFRAQKPAHAGRTVRARGGCAYLYNSLLAGNLQNLPTFIFTISKADSDNLSELGQLCRSYSKD